MASNLNIGRDNADKSYRYKMPPLQTKVEGRGNGIKTVIVNMPDIAKALHVDPAYPTKYFGYELGAQAKFNESTERAIVNGMHTSGDLQKLLSAFIDTFVLCPTCKLPEIKMEAKKDKIKIDCAACGHNSLMATSHRLVQYIVKNPPNKGDKKGATTTEAKKKGKKAGKTPLKGGKGKKGEDDEEDDEEDDTEESSKSRTKATPAESSSKADKSKSGKAAPKAKEKEKEKDKDKEEEWHSDTSKEAQKKRKEAEFALDVSDGQKLVDEILTSAKADNKSESPVTILKVFIATKDRSADEIIGELRRLQLSRGLDDSQRVKTLLEAMIDTTQPQQVTATFKTHASLLKQITNDKKSTSVFLACLEELVGVIEKKLLPRVPLILQTLYETDVLSEEALLAWHTAPPESSWLVNKKVAAQVRLKAKPFIEWLKSAESDE